MYRDALDSIVTPAYSVKVENIEKSGLIWLTYRVEYPVTTATEITLKKISKRVDTNKTRNPGSSTAQMPQEKSWLQAVSTFLMIR